MSGTRIAASAHGLLAMTLRENMYTLSTGMKHLFHCHVIARPKAVAIRFPINQRNPKDFHLNS